MKPKVISDVELAFPAHIVGTYLPAWETIPSEFRERGGPWCRIAQRMFSGDLDIAVTVREGIDMQLAARHLGACLRSFEPKHEHKIAGVAYLMSLWFELDEQP